MKKWISACLFMLFIFSPLLAQDGVEIFGYFESQIMGTKLNNNFIQLYSNKLRLDLKSNLSKNITFAANFNYITYHGKTKWNILDFLPTDAVAEVPPGMEAFYVLPFESCRFC